MSTNGVSVSDDEPRPSRYVRNSTVPPARIVGYEPRHGGRRKSRQHLIDTGDLSYEDFFVPRTHSLGRVGPLQNLGPKPEDLPATPPPIYEVLKATARATPGVSRLFPLPNGAVSPSITFTPQGPEVAVWIATNEHHRAPAVARALQDRIRAELLSRREFATAHIEVVIAATGIRERPQ